MLTKQFTQIVGARKLNDCTEAEQQLLKRLPDSSVSSLIPTGWCRWASHHQKLAPTFPGIDSCLMVTKRDFLEMEASLWLNERSQNVAKGGLSTCWEAAVAVRKQPSIPLINLGRKWTLSWWWWWWWWWWIYFRLLLQLSSILWENDIPLLICRSYGFIGYMRLVVKEHTGMYILICS